MQQADNPQEKEILKTIQNRLLYRIALAENNIKDNIISKKSQFP